MNTFFKLFLIKNEIGAYIICDGRDSNRPKVFLKKINNNKDNIVNAIEDLDYIIPNKNGKYELDENLFSSDAIKVSDTRFIIIFKIKNSFNMLLCIFDFNPDYTGIIVRYYELNFAERNIHISVNIKCFCFKEYFGIIFYDSFSQYPGYMFFNHINIMDENRIDFRNIKINLSQSSSLTTFSFPNNMKVENNLFDNDIKIKIISLPSSYDTGIIVKSSKTNSIISNNDLLSKDDSIIIDTSCSLMGDYYIEFLPYTQETDVEKEIYGNYQKNNSEQFIYFTKANFKLTFTISSCSSEQYLYIKNPNEKYCLSSCNSYNKGILYQDENEKICYDNCSIENSNKKFLYENKCISQCPNGYKSDENNVCILISQTTIITAEETPLATTYIDNHLNIDITNKNIEIESSLKLNNLIVTSIIENNQKEEPGIENTIIKSNTQIATLSESSIIIETSSNKNISPKSTLLENQIMESALLPEKSVTHNIISLKQSTITEGNIISNTIIQNKPIETDLILKLLTQSTLIDNTLIKKTNYIVNESEPIISSNSDITQNNINLNTNSELNAIIESYIKYTEKTNKTDKCTLDLNILISNYKSNNNLLEFIDLEDCETTYYCYLSDTEIESLISVNLKLTYINIQDCKNELINNNILDENSDLLVVSKKQYKHNSHNFELYDISENKINKISNVSICNTKKIETVFTIENKETLERAFALFEQGYDIFNLSSSFYNDICISVNINNSDVTLDIRKNDLKPDDSSLCSEGCTYNGVNLTTRRIKCLCGMNENKNRSINNMEEVEEKFFSYILDMINYKIIKCYILIKNLRNYYHNYGFFIGAGICFLILILFNIFLCRGNNSIKIKYLRNEPKNEGNNLNMNNDIYEISSSDRNLMPYKQSSALLRNDNYNKGININNKKNKNQRKSKGNTIYNNPPKKINNKKTNDNTKKKKKKKNFKKFKKISIEIVVKDSLKDSEKKINRILNKSEDKKEEENNIDYNEMTYKQALIKDRRNIIHMYFSYFLFKIDLVQLFCNSSEFSHLSVTLSLYLFELLLDLSLNALLFSDEVISQKYYNNGQLLLITSNLLSLASNFISALVALITQYLVKYEMLLEAAVKETKDAQKFIQIFVRIYSKIIKKILFFYFLVFIIGIFCTYYLFIFCAIFQKAQKNLLMNYIIGLAWGIGYKVAFSLVNTILRKISLSWKYRRLYIITKFISDKF